MTMRSAVFLCLVLCCLTWVSAAQAQELTVDTSLRLDTTYVFRGAPQYTTLESPSWQLGARAILPQAQGALWAEVRGITTFTQRQLHTRLGSADEVNLSLGYNWMVSKRLSLVVGGIAYLRPQDDPIDYREEVMVELGFALVQTPALTVTPYVAGYGEVYRLRGGYGEGGVRVRSDLGEGFDLTFHGRGGGGFYQVKRENFNHAALSVEMGYRPPIEGLRVGGRVNASVSQNKVSVADGFFERYGVVWSGLVIEYTPKLSGGSKAP